MIKFCALNSNDTSVPQNGDQSLVVTREAQEEEAFGLYRKALGQLQQDNFSDARSTFKELLSLPFVDRSRPSEDEKGPLPPALMLKCRALLAESGGPGCDVLCGRRGGIVRKLTWCVVLALLTVLTFRDCIRVFKEYAEFSTITRYGISEGNDLSFPDVTICNVNPLQRSLLCSETFHESNDLEKDVRARVCGDKLLYLDPNPEDRELREKLQTWTARMRKHKLKTLRKLSNQFNDTILSCTYAHKDCSHSRFFSKSFDHRYGTCFCFHCNVSSPEAEKFYKFESTSSPEEGLQVVLSPKIEEYLPTSSELGFVVMVHGHGFREDVSSDADFVQPGYVTYISLHLHKRTGLPEPYQNPCRRDFPAHLQKLVNNKTKYTREDCLKYCQQHFTREQCNCESKDLPITSRGHKGKTFKICEAPDDECIQSARAIMDLQVTESFCKCHKSCTDIEYYKKVSRSALPEIYRLHKGEEDNRLLAKIVVHYHSFVFEDVQSVPKYDAKRVFSSFGGINGMYMGVSFFILFRLFETLTRAVGLLKRSRKNSKKDQELVAESPERKMELLSRTPFNDSDDAMASTQYGFYDKTGRHPALRTVVMMTKLANKSHWNRLGTSGGDVQAWRNDRATYVHP